MGYIANCETFKMQQFSLTNLKRLPDSLFRQPLFSFADKISTLSYFPENYLIDP